MKLLIMLTLLKRNGEYESLSTMHRRYNRFFSEEVKRETLLQQVMALENQKFLKIEEGIPVLTEAGLKEGNRANFQYYFHEAVKDAETLIPEKIYRSKKNGMSVLTDSIVDDEQMDYLYSQLLDTDGEIIDLGCGSGGITGHLNDLLHNTFCGIDKSCEMIKQAENNYPKIKWMVQDINSLDLKSVNPSVFLLVDSIYFIKEKKQLIDTLYNSLPRGGKIIITYSEYIKDRDNEDKLHFKNTETGKLLNVYGFEYRDFTENEIKLWKLRLSIARELKEEYIRLNREYFYYDKIVEGMALLKRLEANRGRRYIYVVEKK